MSSLSLSACSNFPIGLHHFLKTPSCKKNNGTTPPIQHQWCDGMRHQLQARNTTAPNKFLFGVSLSWICLNHREETYCSTFELSWESANCLSHFCYVYRYVDSDRRFQHVLEACGVNKSLIASGVKEGDTVVIAGVCCMSSILSCFLVKVLM